MRYYRFKIDDYGNYYWLGSKGRKIMLWGREMFETSGAITDGKTGLLACLRSNMKEKEKNPNFKNNLKIAWQLDILSPLYTNKTKFEIRKSDAK